MGQLFLELMRRLFALLDTVVIWAIEKLYALLIMIADTNVFGSMIYQYLGRIYTFLGIFMLFKLTLSMLTYIVNPDELTDKSKGAGKLVSNVVVSLILLVATPTIFDRAFKLQTDLLTTNAVYQIVTGKELATTKSSGSSPMEQYAGDMGKQIAYGVYSSFVYDKTYKDNVMNTDLKNLSAVYDGGKCTNKSNPYCLVDQDTVVYKSGGDFANEYMILASTICGVAVVYMLLTFCLDTAVRAIKLGFLQIIAPIPILSMIDPKTGTKKVLDWAKECGKTFADLFIRLAGLFFAVQVIGLVLKTDNVDGAFTYYSNSTTSTYGSPVDNIFVRLFIIIGALMFVKQLPGLIESLFGIKLSGDGFSLKKKLGSVPGLGVAKALGAGALGFAGGLAANTYAGISNMHKAAKDNGGSFWQNRGAAWASLVKNPDGDFARNKKGNISKLGVARNLAQNVLTPFGGAFSGASHGLTSKEKNLFKAAGGGIEKAIDNRDIRDKRNDAGYGLAVRGVDRLRTFAGVDTMAKAKGIEIGNNIVDMRRQASQYDKMAESIAQAAGWDPTRIETITQSAPGTYAAGSDEQRYLEFITKSTELSGKIIKQEKRQAIFQKESNKK